MTAMTPSIRQVPKLIFHYVDPGDPPCPLKQGGIQRVFITETMSRKKKFAKISIYFTKTKTFGRELTALDII